ncbi:GNAT family N-acetyltransferase [Acinetobacter qingfengensis]|nr:GNAT family N-acetyltransferase [Acinetobacter qingfengensis]
MALAKKYDIQLHVLHLTTAQELALFENLYVSPKVRGQHIGKHLIEYVQQRAKSLHCARLYWYTQESNHTAQKLYDWIADKPGVIEYRMSLV